MMKKILSVILIATLTMFFCACESTQNVESNESNADIEVDETGNTAGHDLVIENDDTINEPDNTMGEEPVNEIECDDGGLSFVGFKIYDPDDYGFTDYDILVKNETGKIINTVSLDVQYLDSDNSIIDMSYPQTPVRVLPGQTLAVDGLVQTDTADYINVTGYSYYTESDDFFSGRFEKIPNAAPLGKSGEYFEQEEDYFEGNAIYGPIMTDDTGDLTVEGLGVEGISGNYIEFYADVRNDTDNDIHTLTICFIFLDEKGNISGTKYAQESTVIQPGQKIRMRGLAEISESEYVTVDKYSFYNSGDEHCSGFFSEIPQAISLINSDKAIVSDNETTKETTDETRTTDAKEASNITGETDAEEASDTTGAPDETEASDATGETDATEYGLKQLVGYNSLVALPDGSPVTVSGIAYQLMRGIYVMEITTDNPGKLDVNSIEYKAIYVLDPLIEQSYDKKYISVSGHTDLSSSIPIVVAEIIEDESEVYIRAGGTLPE